MKNISILGSTGSIGCNALKIVEIFPDKFKVKALACGQNIALLSKQIEKFSPEVAVVQNEVLAHELKKSLPAKTKVEIFFGEEGYKLAATCNDIDMVIAAMVGASGLIPALASIENGKTLALANKETLVMAGELVINKARLKGVKILPIDSEHSAIFQCLQGQRKEDLSKIILTASGGPFLKTPINMFASISSDDALNHPTWRMGKKISIDSATMMNKGLEVIEAKHLFDVSEEMIKILIHPQSIIHSMVSYKDGSVIAQLGIPDMKCAISYAMSYPERLFLNLPVPDFTKIGSLTFDDPDLNKFKCLSLAFGAVKIGKTLPAVLNASNEIAVEAFLNKRLSFDKIPEIIEETMNVHKPVSHPDLDDIVEADNWARRKAKAILARA